MESSPALALSSGWVFVVAQDNGGGFPIFGVPHSWCPYEYKGILQFGDLCLSSPIFHKPPYEP